MRLFDVSSVVFILCLCCFWIPMATVIAEEVRDGWIGSDQDFLGKLLDSVFGVGLFVILPSAYGVETAWKSLTLPFKKRVPYFKHASVYSFSVFLFFVIISIIGSIIHGDSGGEIVERNEVMLDVLVILAYVFSLLSGIMNAIAYRKAREAEEAKVS